MRTRFTPKEFPRRYEISDWLKKYEIFMPWWMDSVNITAMPPQDDDEDAGASCTHEKRYRRLQIQLSMSNIENLDLEDLLLHEICHCYNEPLNEGLETVLPHYVDNKRDRNVINEQLDRRIEEQTEDLSIAFRKILGVLENEQEGS